MGIVAGSDQRGSCLPDECISRAEVAALVARIVDEDLRVTFYLEAPASDLPELLRRAQADGALCAVAHLGYQEMGSLDYYVEEYLDNDQIPVHYQDLPEIF